LEAGIETGLKIIFNAERKRIHKFLLTAETEETGTLCSGGKHPCASCSHQQVLEDAS
jgi:hypothetical protein